MSNTTTVRNIPFFMQILLVLSAILVAGLLVSSFFVTSEPPPDTSVLFTVPPPQSLDELVGRADVIVVGKFGPVVYQGSFSGYDENGVAHLAPAGDPGAGFLPIMDYQIEVEQVLRDDGVIASGKPLIFRAVQSPSDKDIYGGTHNLFFLSVNPDDSTYGPYYGFSSLIPVDQAQVKGFDGKDLPFAPGIGMLEFIDLVQREVGKAKGAMYRRD